MAFGPLDRPAAAQMPGPAAHAEVAAALVPRLARLVVNANGRPKVPAHVPCRMGRQSFSISSGTAVNRSPTRP